MAVAIAAVVTGMSVSSSGCSNSCGGHRNVRLGLAWCTGHGLYAFCYYCITEYCSFVSSSSSGKFSNKDLFSYKPACV